MPAPRRSRTAAIAAAAVRQPRGRVALVLALLLLTAQTIALLHGVLHLPGHQQGFSAPALERWVGQHDEGSALCHAFDQLAKAEGTAPAAAAGLPAPGSDVLPGCVEHGRAVAAARAYQARAPPGVS